MARQFQPAKGAPELQRTKGWPKFVLNSSGKNQKERVMEVARTVGGAMVLVLQRVGPAEQLRWGWQLGDVFTPLGSGRLVLLLPLDLAIVGTDSFTTAKLGDSLATAWAAFSIALGICIAIWSLFLFVRGLEVAGGLGAKRALIASLIALACFGVLVGILLASAALIYVLLTT